MDMSNAVDKTLLCPMDRDGFGRPGLRLRQVAQLLHLSLAVS